MKTLLVLGSKKNPVIPERTLYTDVACANAAGYSAAKYGVPSPIFTLMSSRMGVRTNSLDALTSLRTDTLYFFPRPDRQENLLKKGIRYIRDYKKKAWFLKWQLRRRGYHYDHFVNIKREKYIEMVRTLCHSNENIEKQMSIMHPSSGVLTLVLGVQLGYFDRIILSGFNFGHSHAYKAQDRPTASLHRDTDVTVVNYLATHYKNIYTTEEELSHVTAISMLEKTVW